MPLMPPQPPQQHELSLFPTDTPLVGLDHGGEPEAGEEGYLDPPLLELDDGDGRESPFRRYKHGAPLHNVVEEEEE